MMRLEVRREDMMRLPADCPQDALVTYVTLESETCHGKYHPAGRILALR